MKKMIAAISLVAIFQPRSRVELCKVQHRESENPASFKICFKTKQNRLISNIWMEVSREFFKFGAPKPRSRHGLRESHQIFSSRAKKLTKREKKLILERFCTVFIG